MEIKTDSNNDWLDTLNFCMYVSKAIEEDEIYAELQVLSNKYFSSDLEDKDWKRLYKIKEELK